ncbi:hypothetical protein [Roseococcus sp.]|uniref:hypothetical protein n=1 Tax=Roseococcus sp. TaxID=2109646 RepID=UPI003BAC2456
MEITWHARYREALQLLASRDLEFVPLARFPRGVGSRTLTHLTKSGLAQRGVAPTRPSDPAWKITRKGLERLSMVTCAAGDAVPTH